MKKRLLQLAVAFLLFSIPALAQTLNTAQWKFMNEGGRTGEQESYVSSQCSIDSMGRLILQAAYVNGKWVSCETESVPFPTPPALPAYITIEFKEQIPNAPGSWPASWALGNLCNPFGRDSCPWPTPGAQEYDYAEFLDGNTNSVNEEIHTGSSQGNPTDNNGGQVALPKGGNASTAFHDYVVHLSVGQLQFFIDGVLVQTINDSSITNNPPIFIFNEACGGPGASGSCTSSDPPGPFIVESIVVTDQNGNVFINGFTTAPTTTGAPVPIAPTGLTAVTD